MKKGFVIDHIDVHITPAAKLEDVIRELMLLVDSDNCTINFSFNDIKILIRPADSVDLITKLYYQENSRRSRAVTTSDLIDY